MMVEGYAAYLEAMRNPPAVRNQLATSNTKFDEPGVYLVGELYGQGKLHHRLSIEDQHLPWWDLLGYLVDLMPPETVWYCVVTDNPR